MSEVIQLCLTLCNSWTVAYKAPLFMEFSRQEYWRGLPFPSPGDLPYPGIESGSPTLQSDPLPSEPPGKSLVCPNVHRSLDHASITGTMIFVIPKSIVLFTHGIAFQSLCMCVTGSWGKMCKVCNSYLILKLVPFLSQLYLISTYLKWCFAYKKYHYLLVSTRSCLDLSLYSKTSSQNNL